MSGIGSHESAAAATDEWLTPPQIIEALGPFDLDPCSSRVRPWPTAKEHYTTMDNGLALPWHGRVWLNPPYGQQSEKWIRRLANHGQGTALVYARTETKIFFPWVWDFATGLFFCERRLYFYDTTGNRAKNSCGAPSVLVSYGTVDAERLRKLDRRGKFIALCPTEKSSAHCGGTLFYKPGASPDS